MPTPRKTTTSKAAPKPAPRRRAAPRPKTPPALAPAVVLTSNPDADAAAEEARFPLFEIDGKVYSMPARPPAGLVLQLLSDYDEVGEGFAGMRLLRTVLGVEGFRALTAFKGLQPADLKAISDAAMKITMGALEEDDPTGN